MKNNENIAKITTIKLSKETRNRLEKLKVHKRESYEDVLQKVLSILNVCRVNPMRARLKLNEIDRVKKYSSSNKSFKPV